MGASDSRYLEGLNGLPAEAEVDPVLTGTGIFLLWTFSPVTRGGQKEGEHVKREEVANSKQSIG